MENLREVRFARKMLVLFLFVLAKAQCQNIRFDVNPVQKRPLTKEMLVSANSLEDIINYYPHDWISSYDSVKISSIIGSKDISAKGKNTQLTDDQKKILAELQHGADVELSVWYKFRNPYDHKLERNRIHILFTLVPEAKAEYIGGRKKMMDFLRGTAIDKIDTVVKRDWNAKVRFTVMENGKISEVKLIQTSGDKKTDAIILDAVRQMPKWKSAETSDGVKVKQDFEFTVQRGNKGC